MLPGVSGIIALMKLAAIQKLNMRCAERSAMVQRGLLISMLIVQRVSAQLQYHV